MRKSNYNIITQTNISIPAEWKTELENLARIYSVEKGETITIAPCDVVRTLKSIVNCLNSIVLLKIKRNAKIWLISSMKCKNNIISHGIFAELQ